MNTLLKRIFTFVLVSGTVLSATPDTEAATKPYEYTFEKETELFNGINSMNKVKITLDKAIELKDTNGDKKVDSRDLFDPASPETSPLYVVQKDGTERLNIIKDITQAGNVITILFKNMELVDYTNPEKWAYEIIIDKETIRFDQLEEYRVAFNIYDILPGFKSTFIDTDASIINNNVFKYNAPRDVYVHVPKVFITGIETIHRYQGVIPDQIGPALSNIDIYADEEAARLKVEFGTLFGSQYSRDIMRREDIEGFSMGQAGINQITDNQSETASEFTLRTYNEYGRFLEERKFRLKVADPKKDYIINDYVTVSPEIFGQAYSLYDLMADKTLLESIVTHIPVSQLDTLGITYAAAKKSVSVKDVEQLKMALANDKLEKIHLANNIDLNGQTLTVGRSVTIEGPAEIKGKVELKGNGISVRLNHLTINGDLSLDIGEGGTAVLEQTTVNGTTNDPATKIISANNKSVHLYNFASSNGIETANSMPIRIVTSTPIPFVKLNGTAAVTLEGEYEAVHSAQTTTLDVNQGTKIGALTVGEGKTLTVTGKGATIASYTGSIEFPDGEENVITIPPMEWTYPAEMNNTPDGWAQIGKAISVQIDGDGNPIPSGTTWQVIGHSFDSSVTMHWDNEKNTLKLEGIPTEGLPFTGTIVLQGVNNKAVYNVTVPILVEG